MATKKAQVVPATHRPPGCKCDLELLPHPEKQDRLAARCTCGSPWNGQFVYETNEVEPAKEEPTNGSA